MLPKLEKIKGVHPGAILRRELKARGIKASDLAVSIGEHKQTLSAIINKRRNVNPKLSIKLANHFGTELDYFMHLQASYEVKKSLEKDQVKPDIHKFRRVLFWDTSLDKINWNKNKAAIIKRVLERGNKIEIVEVISFYGMHEIQREIETIENSQSSTFQINSIASELIPGK